MIDDTIREALLVEAHRLIEAAADDMLKSIERTTKLTYPPAGPEGAGLSLEEQQAVLALDLSPVAKSGMRKIVSNAIADAFFGLFCVVDGVGDPRNWQGGTWLGVDLTQPEKGRDRPMLHDEFYETYWEFMKRRG
jgi:hypothetical protein